MTSIVGNEADIEDGTEPSGGITFSLSEEARQTARTFSLEESNPQDERPFNDMLGAVRVAISLGIYTSGEESPPAVTSPGKTIFNLGSLDAGGLYRKTIEALRPDLLESETLARLLRRYAEAGLQIMQHHFERADGVFDAIEVIEATLRDCE